MFITQQSLLSHSSLINRYGLVLSLRLRELKQFTHIHTAREWKSLDSGSRFLSSKLRLSSMLQGSSVKLECVTWQWKISSEGFCKLLHIQSIKSNQPGCWWLTPVILVTWEAEIRRIMVWGQSVNSSRDPPHLQNNHNKMDWKCGSSDKSTCFARAKSCAQNPILKKKSVIRMTFSWLWEQF
jgi:hypothetical protein